jgi:glycine oxidase
MLAPHAEGLTGSLLTLGQRSLERIPAWVAQVESDSGLRCGLRGCGIVVPFASQADRDAYPTARFGVPLDRDALERDVPGIGPTWQAGLLFPQDGQIDNRRRLMRALEGACSALGVDVEDGVHVREFVSEGARLRGVRLQSAAGELRTLACERAVLCCGAWSAQLLDALPVVPIKGQMLSLQGPRDALRRVLFGPGTYLVPRNDGLLVVGATSEPEAGFHEGLTVEGQDQLQQGLTSLLPAAAGWPTVERWWGFRPGTPDEAPLLGAGPLEGLWLATGHYRNGVLLAAITAELIGKAMTGGTAAQPGLSEAERGLLEAFRWDRFGDPQAGGGSSFTAAASA